MAAYRKKGTNEAQPILQQRKNNTLDECKEETLYNVAGLLVAALAQGNAIYVTPGRFGGISFKVYVEGEQYAEQIPLGEATDELVEEILDALYDTKRVAWYRARFGARRTERVSEAREGAESVVGKARPATGPQKTSGGV